MIRFSYDVPEDDESPFEHLSIEGDNERGYVLLAWSMTKTDPDGDPLLVQQWFELLGEALDYCAREYGIMRDYWHAPTVEPPISHFSDSQRNRRSGESTLLNPANAKAREEGRDGTSLS